MPVLLLKLKGTTLKHFYLKSKGSLTIGRSPDNDIVIPNIAVSSHHARIDRVAEGYLLTDLNSTNGTFINERPITTHWLEHGDRVHFVKHTLVFAYMRGERRPSVEESDMERTLILDGGWLEEEGRERTPADPSPQPAFGPVGVLALIEGGTGEIVLNKERVRMGKDPEAEIVVRGIGVASVAASIIRHADVYYLNHEAGLARVRLNGRAVKQPQRLQEQDLIEIGAAKLRFFMR